MEPTELGISGDCKITGQILARIGDKWSVFVIGSLAHRTMRFNELKRRIGGVSQRMLTLTLRGLERDGLVRRTVYPTIPPRVDYDLTPLGRTLVIPLRGIADWAGAHIDEVIASRTAYDSEADAAGEKRAA
ncbi:winged helix-turn-helix transcriptional regulator [Phenylobacterium immobile]|uniref:winged helix-turn-helix transcriptional regulator n=1 Tax=Phenylobacterium immobile TaxID=21 RepID=UPI000A4A5FA6|nr:helix-turn-helix domain-containing protein [Phenylobacterium immobile]